MKEKSSKSSLTYQSGSYETSSIGRLHSKELSGKQVSVNREDAKLHWVHLPDFSPLFENMFYEMGVLFKQV